MQQGTLASCIANLNGQIPACHSKPPATYAIVPCRLRSLHHNHEDTAHEHGRSQVPRVYHPCVTDHSYTLQYSVAALLLRPAYCGMPYLMNKTKGSTIHHLTWQLQRLITKPKIIKHTYLTMHETGHPCVTEAQFSPVKHNRRCSAAHNAPHHTHIPRRAWPYIMRSSSGMCTMGLPAASSSVRHTAMAAYSWQHCTMSSCEMLSRATSSVIFS